MLLIGLDGHAKSKHGIQTAGGAIVICRIGHHQRSAQSGRSRHIETQFNDLMRVGWGDIWGRIRCQQRGRQAAGRIYSHIMYRHDVASRALEKLPQPSHCARDKVYALLGGAVGWMYRSGSGTSWAAVPSRTTTAAAKRARAQHTY